MASISISRDELMTMLKEAKVKADREDAKVAAKHEKEEQAALVKFRAELSAAMKLSYAGAKKMYARSYSGIHISSPACPERHAHRIEVAIRELKADSRKGRFSLYDKHDWYVAAMWLPESERSRKSVCAD